MGLSAEESEVVDAQLGLSQLVSSPGAGNDDHAAAVAAGEAPSAEALAADPLLALQSSAAGLFLTHDNSERTLSNASGLQLSFLWGSTAPNGVKHSTSCVMRTNKSVWLFECGEDAQRHLVRCGLWPGLDDGQWSVGGLCRCAKRALAWQPWHTLQLPRRLTLPPPHSFLGTQERGDCVGQAAAHLHLQLSGGQHPGPAGHAVHDQRGAGARLRDRRRAAAHLWPARHRRLPQVRAGRGGAALS